MTGRRQDRRYRLSVAHEGSLLVQRDLLVERHEGSDVFALSDAPGSAGEQLQLDLMSVPRALVTVRVMESTPVIVGEEMRYRLHLKKIVS